MTCSSIMRTKLTTVSPETPVGETITLLIQHHFRSIPVVNAQGHLLGQFGVHSVLELSVPQAVKIAREGWMTDIPFMDDNMDDMRRRLARVWKDPVLKHFSPKMPVLKPTDSLTRALMYLAKTQDNIAVVDPQTQVLVGIISYWDALDHLSDGQ